MNEIEKAIEEMARTQCNSCGTPHYCEEYNGKPCGKAVKVADRLIAAGYRKIDGNTSDGYHTFNELYHHRAVLFAMICNQNRNIAWKSKKHNDGTMFDGMFIVGIETPQGQATYHYDISPYWDYFKVKELEIAPIWDGHTPSQAIDRILEMSKNARSESEVRAEAVKEFAEKLRKKVCWNKSRLDFYKNFMQLIDETAAQFGGEVE